MAATSQNDDYYASVQPASSDASPSEKDSGAKKLKIKGKKKIVAKKKVVTPEQDTPTEQAAPSQTGSTTVSGDGPAISFDQKSDNGTGELKSVVGNVYDQEKERKKENLDRFAQKGKSSGIGVGTGRPTVSFGTKKKKDDVLPSRIGNATVKSGNEGNDRPTFERKKAPQGEKNFRKKAKPAGGDKKNYKSSKRSKLKPIQEAIPDGFRRSKKMANAPKEEKNIDDMKQTLVSKVGQEVEIGEFLSVKELSDKLGIPVAQVTGELLKNGVMVNLNTQIDYDTAHIVGESLGVTIKREVSDDTSLSDLMDGRIDQILKNDEPSEMVERAPIVSVMGHVDHGKTSILDYIRKTSVAASEAGGITQSIGAYQVIHNDKPISFLDTPGHEAFAVMRSRGAKLTDIIIIVVAADEGLKPQTIESINLAKEAEVPIIVAINKMDKEGANPDLVKGGLAEHGLQPEDWGGETICVPCSAHTGDGIEQILEMILLVSEMNTYKAHPTRPGVGTVIESHLDAQQGVLATVMMNAGEINKGDAVFCGSSHGRIRTLKNYNNKNIAHAGPSTPVLITGLSEVVEGGDVLQVVKDSDTAKTKAQEYGIAMAGKSVSQFEGASLASLMGRLQAGNLKEIKIVLKSDTNGSLEAIKTSLLKIKANNVSVKIIHDAVGAINESDVLMAGTSAALLVGFNVSVLPGAQDTLQKSQIEVINDRVIYRILEKVESIATGMVDIEHEEILIAEGKAKEIFYTADDFMIVGLGLTDGTLEPNVKIKIVRGDKMVGSGKVPNIKQGVEDMKSIESGNDCGIRYDGDTKIEPGDILEFYKTVERKR